ncbi:MAG: T9SS type A sorting domain-containing protein [Bacteroidales bacterium]|nr:T9SS type A sorting domain-containing protein [Bacteroidales bacterium]
MKLTSIVIVIVSIFAFLIPHKSVSSPFMGGEITWECIPNGQPNAGKFIFYAKLYRNCGNTSFGSNITMYTTNSVYSIALSIVNGYPIDISPNCNINAFDSTMSEITCNGAELLGNDTMGAVSEYLYKSLPIQINGIPPTYGWVFYIPSCCRNLSSNINYTSNGYALISKMYAYNNQNTYPCFDNSPVFAEAVKPAISTGYSLCYSNYAWDKDLDSLYYEWGEPMLNVNNSVVYNAGYSFFNPFPNTYHDTNNVDAIIDHNNGTVSFTSIGTGSYLSSIKVSAYRSGQLISENWREIQTQFYPATYNKPPTITPPFSNNTSFYDTVNVGDIVNFNLYGYDIQYLPDGSTQSIDLSIFGNQFGEFIPASGGNASTLSAITGCITPPCATLTPAPSPLIPLSGLLTVSSQFTWQTTINHLDSNNICAAKTYGFIINLKDDFCPVPAINTAIVSITILPPPCVPKIKCINMDTNGYINLKWNPFIDTANIFKAYYLYAADSINGNFNLLDSITNCNIGSYTYNSGYNQSKKIYHYLVLKHHINGNNDTVKYSSIVANIVLADTNYTPCITNLKWNAFDENAEFENYIIHRKKKGEAWLIIDTISQLEFNDYSSVENVQFRILLEKVHLRDSLGDVYSATTKSGLFNSSHGINIGPDTLICSYNDITLYSSGNQYDFFEWKNGESTDYIDINAGDYAIGTHNIWLDAITNYNCKSRDSMILIVDECTAFSEIQSQFIMEIFPNPSNGAFVVKLNKSIPDNAKLEIINLDGKLIFKINNVSKNEIEIDLSDKPKGTYFIKLFNGNQVIQKKITII